MARRQAISPVIATVIIVAVTIAIAIAVAFWMTGIVSLFTGFEKLEVASASAYLDSNRGTWNIVLLVKNTGTSPTTVTEIYINNVLAASISADGTTVTPQTSRCAAIQGVKVTGDSFAINPGEIKEITVILSASGNNVCGSTTLNPGVSVEVRLHTSGGKDYPKILLLSG